LNTRLSDSSSPRPARVALPPRVPCALHIIESLSFPARPSYSPFSRSYFFLQGFSPPRRSPRGKMLASGRCWVVFGRKTLHRGFFRGAPFFRRSGATSGFRQFFRASLSVDCCFPTTFLFKPLLPRFLLFPQPRPRMSLHCRSLLSRCFPPVAAGCFAEVPPCLLSRSAGSMHSLPIDGPPLTPRVTPRHPHRSFLFDV